MNYQKVWEKMNHLEESFSSISTIKELVDDVDRMIDCEDLEKAKESTVLKGYLEIFTRKWDKAFEVLGMMLSSLVRLRIFTVTLNSITLRSKMSRRRKTTG